VSCEERWVADSARSRLFERTALPHLDASYNLARWMTRNEQDAADVVQDAYLRAFMYFDGFKGENARAWLLSIVRRTCYSWLATNRPKELVTGLDENALDAHATAAGEQVTPEASLLRNADARMVNEMIARLPPQYREVVILRELEECSYREIAEIAAIPIGTVMSRLARAREMLQADAAARKESASGL
jgi:RNA polymerase sigma-70 factor (ECF subfamily)